MLEKGKNEPHSRCGSTFLALSRLSGRQVFAYHQSHFEHNRMVELTQIQAGQLLDLLQTVHQGVTVHEQLTGGLRHIQIVLKELVDGEQSLLIQRVDGILLEHLRQEDVTQGGGQLVDQAANTQVLVVHDALFGIEHLTHFDSGLGFLVSIRKLAQMLSHSTDTNDGLDEQLAAEGILHVRGHLLQLTLSGMGGQLLDNSHVGFVDAEHEILELVREQAGDHVHSSHVAVADLPYQEHGPGGIGGEVELAYNFLKPGFSVMPAVGLKWNFN